MTERQETLVVLSVALLAGLVSPSAGWAVASVSVVGLLVVLLVPMRR